VSFFDGCIYRVDPDWEGPKEPKPTYIDAEVTLGMNDVYSFVLPSGLTMTLTSAPSVKGFVGYVYGGIVERNIKFDVQGDIMMPSAVRFRK
jgi:hypothetical protein